MQRPALLLAAALALPATARAGDGPFLAREGPGLWRASELVGVEVVGPDGRAVGGVTDVLLDHDGRAAAVVIGVGRKDVALPFAQVRFADAPRPGAGAAAPQGSPPAPAALGGPAGTTTGVPGAKVTGLAGMPDAPPGGTASAARPAGRPDHATVDLTAEQLKGAPAFTFDR